MLYLMFLALLVDKDDFNCLPADNRYWHCYIVSRSFCDLLSISKGAPFFDP